MKIKVLMIAGLSKYNFKYILPRAINFGAARLYSYLKQNGIDIELSYTTEKQELDYNQYKYILISSPGPELYTDPVMRSHLSEISKCGFAGEIIVGGMISNRSFDKLDKFFKFYLINKQKYYLGEGEDGILNYLNGGLLDFNEIHRMSPFKNIIIEPEAILDNAAPIELNTRCTWSKCTFCVFRTTDYKYASKIPRQGNFKRIGDKLLQYYSRGIRDFYMVGVETTTEEIGEIYTYLNDKLVEEVRVYFHNTKIDDILFILDIFNKSPKIKTKVLGYAPETFEPSIMKQINKNVDIDHEHIKMLAEYCNEHNVAIKVNIMYGISENDKELIIDKYLDFFKMFRKIVVSINCYFDYVKKKHAFDKEDAIDLVNKLREVQRVDETKSHIGLQVHWDYEVLLDTSKNKRKDILSLKNCQSIQ